MSDRFSKDFDRVFGGRSEDDRAVSILVGSGADLKCVEKCVEVLNGNGLRASQVSDIDLVMRRARDRVVEGAVL